VLTTIRSRTEANEIRIEVSATTGRYQGQPARRDLTFRLPLQHTPGEVRVALDGGEGSAIPQADGSAGGASCWWREGSSLVWVRVPQVPVEQTVSVTVLH
jgi:hypothetical protein